MDDLERRIAAVPRKHQGAYVKALQGKASPRGAIRAMCYSCVCWVRFDGGSDRIGGCGIRACPLWQYRPFRKAAQPVLTAEGSGSSVEQPEGSPEGQP